MPKGAGTKNTPDQRGVRMKIAFLGDICLTGQFDLLSAPDALDRLAVLKDKLKDYDLVAANLESPLTQRTKTMVCKSMHLRSDTGNVKLLTHLGIGAVTLANNHVLDFGRKGLDETIRVLEDAGIGWYGVDGRTLTKEIGGEKVTFSGFCCYSAGGVGYNKARDGKGPDLLSRDNLAAQLKKDAADGSFSVLSLHFGLEHTNYPSWEHICLAEEMAAVKPLVIHGHHPHQIQGIKSTGGSLVAYSLGNALFDDTVSLTGAFKTRMNEENRKSFVLGVEIVSGRIASWHADGFYIGSEGIVDYPIENSLGPISQAVADIPDVEKYKEMRLEQYRKGLQSKFGKHDLKWLMSRMNYYSIGAKLDSKKLKKLYSEESARWAK